MGFGRGFDTISQIIPFGQAMSNLCMHSRIYHCLRELYFFSLSSLTSKNVVAEAGIALKREGIKMAVAKVRK